MNTESTVLSHEATSAPARSTGDLAAARRSKAAQAGIPDARRAAVRILYQRHHRPLGAFVRRLVGSERAEDVVQEVFFRLLRLENLETREISVSYLFRMGENLVRKGYHQERRSRRTLEAAGRLVAGRIAAEEQGRSGVRSGHEGDQVPGNPGITRVHAGMLTAALGNLTDNEQAAVRLIVCRGLSYEQAAEALGVTVTTINNWKYRGVKKLQELFGPDPDHCCRSDRGANLRNAGRPDSRRRNRGESGANQGSAHDPGEPTRPTEHGRGRRRFGRTG